MKRKQEPVTFAKESTTAQLATKRYFFHHDYVAYANDKHVTGAGGVMGLKATVLEEKTSS